MQPQQTKKDDLGEKSLEGKEEAWPNAIRKYVRM
jgi:hypothetical protein